MTTTDRFAWRTSSRSSNGENCVEVAPTTNGVVIRHSKHRNAGVIAFSFHAWTTFVHEALGNISRANGVAAITKIDGETRVRSLRSDVELCFDQDEWSAFIAGAADGEFDFSDKLAVAV